MLLRRPDTLENVHQLHFDGVTGAITNRAFGTGRYNKVVIQLGSALFDCANNVFPGVGRRQPFVYGGHLTAKTLKLVHRHGANFD